MKNLYTLRVFYISIQYIAWICVFVLFYFQLFLIRFRELFFQDELFRILNNIAARYVHVQCYITRIYVKTQIARRRKRSMEYSAFNLKFNYRKKKFKKITNVEFENWNYYLLKTQYSKLSFEHFNTWEQHITVCGTNDND